jgi:hypothetical protein
MPTVKGANVTKLDAGGSGDNIIAQGLVKTVEKVWLDTYTYSSSATIGSGLVIEIAAIAQGRKITGVDVYGVGTLTATSTNTISIGTKLASGVTNATLFLAATTLGTLGIRQFDVISANTGLYTELTGGTNKIILTFGAANPSVTGGTLYTKVRYT